jgi:hypothetical protein
MGKEMTVVDLSSPEAIASAISFVNNTKGLRIEPGIKALWELFRSPGYTLPRAVLDQKFGALDLHFGWFCRRVAERLGANEPDAFALVDYSRATDGSPMLTLKPSVVTALRLGDKKGTKTSK